MKPANTLLTLLTVAAAGVDVASAQFVTSTTTAPALAARNNNNAAILNARQDGEIVHKTITRTVRNGGSRASAKPTPSSSRKDDDDDDDDDDSNDNDDKTTTIRDETTQTRSSSSSNLDEPTSTATNAVPSPSSTEPTTSSGGGGLSAGAAAGVAAGAVAGLAIIAAVAFLFWRRRQGGIRGAVVTADYPRGMSTTSDPKLPPPDSEAAMGTRSMATIGKDDPFYPGMDDRYGDGDGDEDGDGNGESNRAGASAFRIPPAGTMPGNPQYDQYQYQYQQQQSPMPHQQWASDERHVSALTAYPSPGQPILPVSPMTPYYPNQRHVSSYYGGNEGEATMMAGGDLGSPEMPTYLVPGGNQTRAMSFSSVSQVGGGGPRVPELVGPRPPVPSIMVVVEGQPSPRPS